jgi:HEPN domain-containing protein
MAAKSIAHVLREAARQDLAACKLLSTGMGIGDAMVGFHAQQAVEKAIKSVLSTHNVEFRRTRVLDTLVLVMAWAEAAESAQQDKN